MNLGISARYRLSQARDRPSRYAPGMSDDQPFIHSHPATTAYNAPVPVTTAFEFPGWHIQQVLGPAFGLVVRSMGFGNSIGASFRSMVGGEVRQYTQLLEDSRRHALDRMVDNARLLGANAIIGMRFDSSEMGQGLTEIVAYGTGVIVMGSA